MDFESLLCAARKNQLNKKEPVKCLTTKFKPPTKDQQKKEKALSDGIQKFLARKEEEEKQKKKEANKKREELLALRSLDPKANKRIQTMLKRTKSANKSVMEDAIDSNNTADTLAGPSQPDEDDYGFVSETSTAMYEKLLKKMYSTPSDDLPKFAPSKKPVAGNLLSTKERVKRALEKQEEEEHAPHKRKRKKKAGAEEDDENLGFGAPERLIDEPTPKEPEKPKPKRPPGPPPMDFMDLLKLAEKKQHEPVVIEPKSKKTEPDHLMTKKQREEHRKMMEWKQHREQRLKAQERGETPPSDPTEKPAMKRIPKVGQTSSEQRNESKVTKSTEVKSTPKPSKSLPEKFKTDSRPRPVEKPSSSLSKPKSTSEPARKAVESETEKLKRERDEVLKVLKEKEAAFKILEEKERLIRERDEALARLKMFEEKEKKMKSSESKPATKVPEKNGVRAGTEVQKPSSSKPASREVPSKSDRRDESSKSQKFPSKDVRRPEPGKSREFPPKDVRGSDVKPREFPPKDVRRPDPGKSSEVPPKNGKREEPVKSREFPPKDVRRPDQVKAREFPPRDVKRIVPKNGDRLMTKEEMVRKKIAELKRRRIEDSDEDEYDSELDDFIDDGPDPSLEKAEVSKVISEIFKYDKNRYSRYDDDAADECMESNWAQITKEEYYSTKCGILEDLEDIKAEKEALARKKKNKK